MMKQFEIMEAARVYVTVKDGDTEIDVPMTIKAAAHRYADTEKAKAYDLAAAAEEYDFTVKAREDAKQARLAEKARKDAEKARAKAQRDAVKAAKKAKREAAKTDTEGDSVEQ